MQEIRRHSDPADLSVWTFLHALARNPIVTNPFRTLNFRRIFGTQNIDCQIYLHRLRFFLVRDRPKEQAFDGDRNPFSQNIS